MRLRYKIGGIVIILGSVFLFGRCGGRTTGPKSTLPTVLPPNDIEQISVNPDTHQLVIQTAKGIQTITLPDRTSTIDVLKNGTVKVTSPQMGLEHHIFAGAVLSDHARIGIGMDAFYYKKLDIGLGVADQIGSYTPVAFAKVTYNVKGNMQVGIVYQSNQYVGGIVAVRIF